MELVKLLANFSKASYSLTHKGYQENPYWNDPNSNADLAYKNLLLKNWTPIHFTAFKPTVDESNYFLSGSTGDGFFLNRNAAVFVARSGDDIVLAFRGTNDAGKDGINPYDSNETIHPDKDQWGRMPDHYQLLRQFLDTFDVYVKNSGVKNVLVTGHSMGGALAIEYMSKHSGDLYQAVTFAATPFGQPFFWGLGTERKDYLSDSRITQIEIKNDPGPMMFDVDNLFGDKNYRPGHVVELQGSETLDSPDINHVPIVSDYYARDANHSMDYYLAMANAIDDKVWDALTAGTAKQSVFIDAKQIGKSYVVDGLISGTNQAVDAGNSTLISSFGANLIYGGRGNDTIYSSSNSETILGGIGNDKIYGSAGSDAIDGGDGFDVLFYAGSRSNYSVLKDVSGSIVIKKPVSQNLDSLNNIERIYFTDSAIAFDLSGSAGKIYRLYQAAFDRKPDFAGLGYWINDMDKGANLSTIASGFFQSIEFQKLYGSQPSNASLVTKFYQNVLHRTPDQAGFDYWIDQLDHGKITPVGALVSFCESSENQLQVIGAIQYGIQYQPWIG